MGTRNLTIVQSDGKYKVGQYCQWDGYPSGQGITILETLRNMDPVFDIPSFKQKVDGLKQLTSEEVQAYWAQCGADDSGWVGMDVSEKFKEKYAHLHRDFGGRIIEAIATGKVTEVFADVAFAGDSLFCEWAYVIDLDKNTFEVYKGFNECPLKKGERFKFLTRRKTKKDPNPYKPVRLLASWPLDALPTDEEFYAIEKSEEYDEVATA
jgi:hypothetical protein